MELSLNLTLFMSYSFDIYQAILFGVFILYIFMIY